MKDLQLVEKNLAHREDYFSYIFNIEFPSYNQKQAQENTQIQQIKEFLTLTDFQNTARAADLFTSCKDMNSAIF